jgi:hypothetical protein
MIAFLANHAALASLACLMLAFLLALIPTRRLSPEVRPDPSGIDTRSTKSATVVHLVASVPSPSGALSGSAEPALRSRNERSNEPRDWPDGVEVPWYPDRWWFYNRDHRWKDGAFGHGFWTSGGSGVFGDAAP